MLVKIHCEYCGAKLSGLSLSGSEHKITVRPCYNCMRDISLKAADIIQRRKRKEKEKTS